MTITALGELPLSAVMPRISSDVGTTLAAIIAELTSLAGELTALQADLLAFESEAAALAGDLSAATGIVTDMQTQLARGIQGFTDAINNTIQQVTSGAILQSLLLSLAGGPAAMLSAMQAAVADAIAKVTAITNRVASIAARIVSIQSRIASIVSRIAALTAIRGSLQELQNLFAVAGVHLYKFEGATNVFGTELQAQLAAGLPGGASTDVAYSLVLVTRAAASWTAIATLFRTIP